jgi:tetratricopeptide (TPR) repeat protein
MTADHKKKLAAECFRKGNEAMVKGNFDYAVEMHGTAVQLIPDNLTFRQTLRGCEQRMYNNNKKGAKMVGFRLTGIRNKIRKARSKKDWAAQDQAAEEGLTLNPWDAQLNADMGEACYNLGYTEIAQFGYVNAVESEPENKELLRKLAGLYELRGNYSGAIECWRKISKIEPNNREVRSKITGLEAMQVMDRGGYEEAKTTQEVRRSAYDDYRLSTDKHAPDQVLGPGVSLEADLQRALRKNPADKGTALKLADFYQRQKEFAKAADVLKQALEASGGDYNIREMMEDNNLTRMRHEIDLAVAMTAKDEAGQKTVESLKRELHLREIEVYSARVERYPMDAGLKLDLANRYMKSKEFKKAIPLLQGATADQRRAAEVLVALGKCFINEGQDRLARAQFEKAVTKLNAQDHADTLCEAQYILGRLYERAKERDKAETAYHEVLSINYAYKDARDRLEALQGEGDDKPKDKDDD